MQRSMRVSWTHTKFDQEKLEFQEAERQLGIPMSVFRKSYLAATPSILYPSQWSKLENTSSWKCKSFQDVFKQVEFRNRSAAELLYCLDRIVVDRKSALPTVIAYTTHAKEQKLRLLTGNTTLCICSLLKIQPKILIVDVIGYGDDQ